MTNALAATNTRETSVAANREWFRGDYAPPRGTTIGMTTLLAARQVLLLAFGSSKAQAVATMLVGPPTSACPASLFQRHPKVRIVLDELAASGMRDSGIE
jgi:glucosamine-6-phosphate deaminase